MRKLVAGLALGVSSAAVVLAIGAGGWLDRAEMATYDWRTKLTADRSPANPEIVLVEINDSSVRDLSFFYGRWPWPRLAFADLITYLNRAPARVIAVDFTFPEEQHDVTFKIGGAGGESWTGEQSDKALVEAVRKANVILLADANYVGNQGGDQVVTTASWTSPFRHLGSFVEERPSIVPPFQALTDAARGLGIISSRSTATELRDGCHLSSGQAIERCLSLALQPPSPRWSSARMRSVWTPRRFRCAIGRCLLSARRCPTLSMHGEPTSNVRL